MYFQSKQKTKNKNIKISKSWIKWRIFQEKYVVVDKKTDIYKKETMWQTQRSRQPDLRPKDSTFLNNTAYLQEEESRKQIE